MKYEVLKFTSSDGIHHLQKKMNNFFEEYSESVEVVDISYHNENYCVHVYGSDYSKNGNIVSDTVSALVTIKNCTTQIYQSIIRRYEYEDFKRLHQKC